MKLNPDCVRDILLECEEGCTPSQFVKFPESEEFIMEKRVYSHEETLYHLRQCKLNGYFSNAWEDMMGNFTVQDLSPKAHEFLANTKDKTNWEKTKTTASKVGSMSLSVLSSIASAVVSGAIKAHLGI